MMNTVIYLVKVSNKAIKKLNILEVFSISVDPSKSTEKNIQTDMMMKKNKKKNLWISPKKLLILSIKLTMTVVVKTYLY